MKQIYFNDNRPHLLFENRHLEIGATGHYWDFCWFIVNKYKDQPLKIVWSQGDIEHKIDADDGLGLFLNEENRDLIKAISKGAVYYE